jgi:cell division protein FtsW (lipid II flippase)
VLLLVVGATMIYSAGLRWYQAAAFGAIGLAALPALWFSLQSYMQRRLIVFLDPTHDPGAAYNIDQALIAIGFLTLGYILALERIGFLLSGFLLLFVILKGVENLSWRKALWVVFLTLGVSYLLFHFILLF